MGGVRPTESATRRVERVRRVVGTSRGRGRPARVEQRAGRAVGLGSDGDEDRLGPATHVAVHLLEHDHARRTTTTRRAPLRRERIASHREHTEREQRDEERSPETHVHRDPLMKAASHISDSISRRGGMRSRELRGDEDEDEARLHVPYFRALRGVRERVEHRVETWRLGSARSERETAHVCRIEGARWSVPAQPTSGSTSTPNRARSAPITTARELGHRTRASTFRATPSAHGRSASKGGWTCVAMSSSGTWFSFQSSYSSMSMRRSRASSRSAGSWPSSMSRVASVTAGA